MTILAQTMLVIFIIAWCVGVASHLYATRYFLPMWAAGFRKKPQHAGYGRKVLMGYGIFVAAVAVGLVAGWVAEYWGGGW